MENTSEYYVVKGNTIPDVLLKVAEANRLLDSGSAASIQDAAAMVGISRSSFYKYKDSIAPYHKTKQGKTATLVIQMADKPGMFLDVLKTIAAYQMNVITIHQSVTVNGVANLMLTVQAQNEEENVLKIVDEIGHKNGIHYIKIISKE